MSATLELIRVRGQVQGVGFRPAVSRLAAQLGLPGWVKNDADGVLIALGGDAPLRERFLHALLADLPPLARVHEVVRGSRELDGAVLDWADGGFAIIASSTAQTTAPRAQVVPDAALCAACAAEVLDPLARRYRYPLTNCTHCGPRFSIALGLPWDRERTTMAAFDLCAECRAQYEEPSDRRYHAEPIACHVCGPRATLARCDGKPFAVDSLSMLDAVDAVASLLQRGQIVALKGIGGYHLLADATQDAVVERLRSRKQRPHKPFALMARDLDVVGAYCELSAAQSAALRDPSAPIVLLRARADAPPLSAALTPGATGLLGFMLPSTPLHLLALRRMGRPVICTSGNRSEEPQVIDDAEVRARLGEIADWVLSHDRPIHNRVDDSVVRVFGGKTRVLRRARGLAPAPIDLPPGFESVAARARVLAVGADLKAAVCLSRAQDLVLSQHLGDLDDAQSYLAYREQCARLCALFEHRPTQVVADNHPDSRAARFGEELGLGLATVAHHHAHFAACLGDNAVALGSDAMLGWVLDGTGAGEDDRSAWGCELLVGGYAEVRRVGTLLATPLLGGDRAAREPWRCLYAQLRAAFGRQELAARIGGVPALAPLQAKPLGLLEQMFESGVGAPLASSCGRLFDAVAAVLGVCFEGQSFEAQAAQELEGLAARAAPNIDHGYAFGWTEGAEGMVLDPRPIWGPLLADLAAGADVGLIAARFHAGLAAGLAQLCAAACERGGWPRKVALSGGCMQNAVLHDCLHAELRARGFTVLSHANVPANDGGIAFGQALCALARIARETER